MPELGKMHIRGVKNRIKYIKIMHTRRLVLAINNVKVHILSVVHMSSRHWAHRKDGYTCRPMVAKKRAANRSLIGSTMVIMLCRAGEQNKIKANTSNEA